MDTGINTILERKAERDAAKKQRREERDEAGVVNKLVVEFYMNVLPSLS